MNLFKKLFGKPEEKKEIPEIEEVPEDNILLLFKLFKHPEFEQSKDEFHEIDNFVIRCTLEEIYFDTFIYVFTVYYEDVCFFSGSFNQMQRKTFSTVHYLGNWYLDFVEALKREVDYLDSLILNAPEIEHKKNTETLARYRKFIPAKRITTI